MLCRYIFGINHYRVALQESRDDSFIYMPHADDILEQPEKRPRRVFRRFAVHQNSKEIEEQSASTL